MCTLNIEKEMRVSLNETASQRLQIYMNDIFTLLMLPLVSFFFNFSTDKKLSAMKKPVVMKVALNTKKAIQSIMVYFRRVLHRFMVWQTRTCWTDFKLTESNVLQHIHFTLFLDNDWYICRWTWISYIKYKYFINAL